MAIKQRMAGEGQVDTKRPAPVRREVCRIYTSLFPEADAEFAVQAFGWFEDCFHGRRAGYQPIDTLYHDLEHTLQGTLCMVRLMEGWKRHGGSPGLTQRMFELGLLAILFHDTGYLKAAGDNEGTGAKYTYTHVARSMEFAGQFLGEQGMARDEIGAIQRMIRCTGVNVDLSSVPFASQLERKTGFALGTSDLLGQMAAPDYLEKLPALFLEFAESREFNGPAAHPFVSEEDLIQKTPAFWEKYVQKKIRTDFENMFEYLCVPYPEGPNDYLVRIEQNIARLKARLSAAASK